MQFGKSSTRFGGAPNVHSRRSQGGTIIKIVVGALCCMIFVGVVFGVFLSPKNEHGIPVLGSALHLSNEDAALDRLLKEESLRSQIYSHSASSSDNELPNWNEEFWTPIDLDVSSDPMVVLCKLDFKAHWQEPHSTPMFRDLVTISSCVGKNRRRERMSVLLDEIARLKGVDTGRVVEPTGFVFHESRVGSTLVANMLATDPWALVFSESTPIANAIMHCESCSHQRKVQLFRDVMTLMGRSPFHRRLYVKFQSIATTRMKIALEAFPRTPWAFIFRQPVQTMMSHMDPAKGNHAAAPCLRSKRNPPTEVVDAFRSAGMSPQSAPNEAWCAAHLNMLCNSALEAYRMFNSTTEARPRALLINYESLPGVVPKALMPLFEQQLSELAIERMAKESVPYSKSRGNREREFDGDSKDKDSRATDEIKTYAQKLLSASFQALEDIAIGGYKRLRASSSAPQWSEVKSFEHISLVSSFVNESYPFQHSTVLDPVYYQPWLPFANRHQSQPVDRVSCPLTPAKDYPKTYNMMKILDNWNADSTDIPEFHFDSLCHFDYQNSSELSAAYAYRAKEVPFVLYNIPELDAVVKKWNDVRYVSRRLGGKSYRTETSMDNHFMYWSGGKRGGLRDWTPPTKVISSTFKDWLQIAMEGQNKSLLERTHQYFRVSSDAGNEWLYEELPFFKPKRSMFIVEPREQRGIHCRFGMRSVIAEAHFDGSRNFVAMMFGLRRWIMTHPDQCKHMHMLQRPHPSARHSAVDWSKPDTVKFPNFNKVVGNEVILQPGDMLFVPTVWIHYIVSLNVNIQCNTRSGIFHGYDGDVRDCGF